MEWYLAVLRKYVDFSGRARRKEYWMYTLINILIVLVPYVFIVWQSLNGSGSASGLVTAAGGLIFLYSLATFLPGLGVLVRRLHNTGRSGWWVLINFVPFFGAIAFLVFLCQDSKPGTNEYGSNPKASAW